MLDVEIENIFEQIIDQLMSMNHKLDQLIEVNSNLTNTIIKYDSEYQKQIVAGES